MLLCSCVFGLERLKRHIIQLFKMLTIALLIWRYQNRCSQEGLGKGQNDLRILHAHIFYCINLYFTKSYMTFGAVLSLSCEYLWVKHLAKLTLDVCGTTTEWNYFFFIINSSAHNLSFRKCSLASGLCLMKTHNSFFSYEDSPESSLQLTLNPQQKYWLRFRPESITN